MISGSDCSHLQKYVIDYQRDIKDTRQCEFLYIHIIGMKKDRSGWQTRHSMCSVLSYNGKVHFDICILEELMQKSLVTCLGFGLENHIENMSNGFLRESVERRLRKISKMKFLKLWQSKTQGQYSRGWIRATNEL